MQRRIGEHNPQAPVVAEICEVLRSFLFQRDNGAAYAFQKRSLRLRDPAERPGAVEIPAHDRQRLFFAVLPPPETADRLRIARVAGEMDATEPFDRENVSPGQSFLRFRKDVPGDFPALCVEQPDLWPAAGAAVRLGMITAGMAVFVFRVTGGAHGKLCHGRRFPVVREVADDGKAGATVRTIDKRIAVPPVSRVRQLPQAGGAGSDIRRNQGAAVPLCAASDGKTVVAHQPIQRYGANLFHNGQRGGRAGQFVLEAGKRFRWPFQFQLHAGGGISHPAAQGVPLCETVQIGPEPHPLHNAGDFEPDATKHTHANAARIRPSKCCVRASSPSPVRLETWNRGPSGLTPR